MYVYVCVVCVLGVKFIGNNLKEVSSQDKIVKELASHAMAFGLENI